MEPITSISALAFSLLTFLAGPPDRTDRYAETRNRMTNSLIRDVGLKNKRVVQAMRQTPRHEFVRADLQDKAYLDITLPIGERQTISPPFIVALMTEAIDPQPTDKVLEIGTGSGYQAAVLSPLVDQVYSIEIVEWLAQRAKRTLDRLQYKNIHVKAGDGFKGWPEQDPFDKIIVTCSPEQVPQPLVEQLKEGGLMVIPVGERYQQTLYLMRKQNGRIHRVAIRPTMFVSMTGQAEQIRQVQPNPQHPQVVNSGFESTLDDTEYVTGWFFQRHAVWETDEAAPEGQHYVTFRNQAGGRSVHLLQGLTIDGGTISTIRLSAHVKTTNVRHGPNRFDESVMAITFFDSERKLLGDQILGPFAGSQGWHRVEKLVRVPPDAQEAILRIGLLGATGQISFDKVEITSISD